MDVQNLEAGLRRTMVLVFRQRGLSAAQADAKAEQNLRKACAVFTAKHREAVSPSRAGMRTSREGATTPCDTAVIGRHGTAALEKARRAVATWAHGLM